MALKVAWFALRKTQQVRVNSLLVFVGYAFGGTSNSQNEIKLHMSIHKQQLQLTSEVLWKSNVARLKKKRQKEKSYWNSVCVTLKFPSILPLGNRLLSGY